MKLKTAKWSESEIMGELSKKREIIEVPISGHLLESVIYFLLQDDEIVYIGKSEKYQIYSRLKTHQTESKKQYNRALVMPLNGYTTKDLLLLERALIFNINSKYNEKERKGRIHLMMRYRSILKELLNNL